GVDLIALFECAVELHPADDAPQRRLRELCDREHVVRRAIGRKPRIGDLKIQNAVDLQLRVVLGDADLRRDVERNLPQVMPISDSIDEWDDEIQSRLEYRVKFSPALDDQRALLRDDAN